LGREFDTCGELGAKRASEIGRTLSEDAFHNVRREHPARLLHLSGDRRFKVEASEVIRPKGKEHRGSLRG
jgi:hypothetical protein